jgi:pilus assembly protein Flp/PilA
LRLPEQEGWALTGFVYRFLADENATTAIEYALIASGIALAIIATVVLVGEAVRNDLNSVSDGWP